MTHGSPETPAVNVPTASSRAPAPPTMIPPDRHLRVPGTRNLRDVGGYPAGPGRRTRWGTLFRTDSLDRLPMSSIERLVALGIRQVIDLRWPHELVAAPSVFATHSDVTYRSIPLLQDDPTPALGLAGVYRHIIDERVPQLVEIARAVAEPGGLPAVIGCTAGKDRTGVAIAVLLAAAGVPSDVIAADYTLSAELFAADVADEHLGDWRAGPVAVECPPEHILGALDHLETEHGGARRLLLDGGLAAADLDALVERLTEPADGHARARSDRAD